MRQKLVLSPKKKPSTPRGEETYRALVTATARLLEQRGYEALTTNHVAQRAGVGIATVYEFFPSKHALVASVVDQTVASVLAELTSDLEHALAHSREPVAEWIGKMFTAIAKRKRLFSVLVQEVPFFYQVPSVLAARADLHALALRARALNAANERGPHVEAMTYLMPIMVAHAVLDSVVRPPEGLALKALESALIDAVKRLVE
jgi:AcrR family transcriptional regulator